MTAFRRGDYRASLQATEGLRAGGSRTPEYCYFRSTMLMHLGELGEAEKWLREESAREKDPRRAALGQSTLGQLLLHQQRYDEAMDCFTASRRQ